MMSNRSSNEAHDAANEEQRSLDDDLRKRERTLMRLGLASQESMLLVPGALARDAEVSFPTGAVLDAR